MGSRPNRLGNHHFLGGVSLVLGEGVLLQESRAGGGRGGQLSRVVGAEVSGGVVGSSSGRSGVVGRDGSLLLSGAGSAGRSVLGAVGSAANFSNAVNTVGSVVSVAFREGSGALDDDGGPLGELGGASGASRRSALAGLILSHGLGVALGARVLSAFAVIS